MRGWCADLWSDYERTVPCWRRVDNMVVKLKKLRGLPTVVGGLTGDVGCLCCCPGTEHCSGFDMKQWVSTGVLWGAASVSCRYSTSVVGARAQHCMRSQWGRWQGGALYCKHCQVSTQGGVNVKKWRSFWLTSVVKVVMFLCRAVSVKKWCFWPRLWVAKVMFVANAVSVAKVAMSWTSIFFQTYLKVTQTGKSSQKNIQHQSFDS